MPNLAPGLQTRPNTPVGTLWRRSLRRVDRRARAYIANPNPVTRRRLEQACALANRLAQGV